MPYTLKDLDEGEKAEIKSVRKNEYFELYSPNEYDPALCDIQLSLLPRVINTFQLSGDDTFVDLGSSTGRLVVATKLYSNCRQSMGIELSPSRSQIALDIAKKIKGTMNLHSFGDNFDVNGVSFFCGDFTDPDVITKAGDCYFLGPGKLHRKNVIKKVLYCLCQVHQKDHKRHAKIVCAGFTLPKIDGIRCTHGITFPRDIKETTEPSEKNVYGCLQQPHSSLRPMTLSESSMSNSIKDYDFYTPMYGMENGPRCLFYFDCDFHTLQQVLLHSK